MGNSRWSDDSYSRLQADYKHKPKDQVFTKKSLAKDMNPFGIKFREARDSDEHPETLGIMVWLDETGSMGDIPEYLIKNKLGTMINTLMAHGVKDPAVFFGGIGDHISDSSPLQIGQFESGTDELNKWLTSIYLEGNGGGQRKESYLLAWLFAARHTSIDCFEKRGQKGFLFTLGDEGTWEDVDAAHLKKIMGYSASEGITAKEILNEAERQYHVFHIRIMQGAYPHDAGIGKQWKDLLGERVINCDDKDIVAEIMASTVALVHGVDLDDIAKSFDTATGMKVKNALVNIPKGTIAKAGKGVVNV